MAPLDPTVSTALTLIESSFPNNTREQNIDLLQTESYYLYKDTCVHGLATMDCVRTDKTFIFALAISTDDQRIGYGSFMLRCVAEEHTCDKIYVQSDKAAVPFYEKIGFVPATDEKNAKCCKAMVIDRSKLLNLDVARPENMHIKCHTFQDADIQSLSVHAEDVMDIDTEASTESDDPAVYDVTVLPTGPLSEESKNLVGSGGCTAFSLYQLGVFSSTEDATRKLNYYGEKQLQKLRDDNGGSYERSRVYVKNDSWSSEVIKRAVVAAGFDFKKLDLDSDDVCLKRDLKNGEYLLDGVQNQDHTRHQGSVYTNVPGYSPGPAEAPMHWRHAIAIRDGKVYEQNADVFSTNYLWLKADNRPDVNKGYMREVLKVYKITKQPDKRTAESASYSASKRPRVNIASAMYTTNDMAEELVLEGSDGKNYVEATAQVLPTVFAYRMVHDDGAAPCHDGGMSTLAICKADIRNAARIGDIIVGVVSSTLAKASVAPDLHTAQEHAIVYIATVDSCMTMQEYCTMYSDRADAIYDYCSGTSVQKPNPYHDHRNVASDLKGGVLLLKDAKRCIGTQSTEFTFVTSELMKTVPRGQLTVEPGDANYEDWIKLAMETVTVSNPVHIGSSDKARQQRVVKSITRSVTAAVAHEHPDQARVNIKTTLDELNLAYTEEYPGFIIVHKFAEKYLGIDPTGVLNRLIKDVPVRGAGDKIVPGQMQWVDGDNENLMYRGNVLRSPPLIFGGDESIDSTVAVGMSNFETWFGFKK
eukprot:COSAG02_NODE_6083_length_3814_cov_6.730283_1_plen_757_part_00